MNYTIKSNQITFAHNNKIAFEYPVEKILEVYDVLIVMLEIPNHVSERRNVFAFDRSGDFLWQIKDVLLHQNGDFCPFVEITINDQNELVLFNWCDTAVIVDPHTGDVIRTYQTK